MKFGKAFSDNVFIEKIKRTPLKEPDASWWLGKGRTLFFTSVLFIGFFVLLFRLFNLTVIKGHAYRLIADTNRTRDLVIHAPRGILFDRTGKPLTVNTRQFQLTRPCEDNTMCTSHMSQKEGEQLNKEGLGEGWFLEEEYLREYPFGDRLSHVVGYLGALSEKEFRSDYYSLRNYVPGSFMGRVGAEAVFEEKLRGRDGRELVEVDASGVKVRSLGRVEAIQGENVTLSLDATIAQVAGDAFPSGARGAVIVSKPSTGELLALYSSPSFSPQSVSDFLQGPNQPFFNRAIGGMYPPGSTFKIVTALAALSEKAITKETTVEDIGVIRIGQFSFPNWYFLQYGKTEGNVDIVKAMQRSNDIFFYKAGEWVGISKLVEWAQKLGIGKPLGIELAGEASGLMPDPAWKNLHFDTESDKIARNNEWYLGDTYHVSIGQGYLLTTPLQVNAWTNVIANNGEFCKPTILKGKGACKDLKIDKQTINLIAEGMRKACESGGTGWPLFNFKVPVACKTGTAEFGDPNNRTHAWFTVFAPLESPEISITVLVEGAGEGSNVAAPIAKKILESWFGP